MKNNGSILRQRIYHFAIEAKELIEFLPSDYYYENLKRQLARSSASVYLNFGEADTASSRKDFVHKLRLCSKELRESCHNLELICTSESVLLRSHAEKLLSEADEIGAMLFASIRTASRGLKE
jgi:four helix bundle protein